MITKIIYFITLLVCFCTTSLAQQLNFSQGSSNIIAETGTAIEDAFSIFNNPAAMSLETNTIGISAKRYYLIDGLNTFNASSSFNTKIGAVGTGVNYFGDELYNELAGTVGLSRQLTEKIKVGVSMVYLNNKAEYAESTSAIYPQLGVLATMSEQFQFGANIRNPFSQDLKEPYDQNNLQALISFGGYYQPDEEFATTFQADIVEGQGLSSGLGIKYKALEKFSFSLGGRLNPGYVTAGIGLKLDKIDIDLGSQYQNQLGFSPTFSAQTELK